MGITNPKICYLLWDFSIGGAQIGLLNLLESGFSEKADITLVGVDPGGVGIFSRVPQTVHVVKLQAGTKLLVFSKFLWLSFMYARTSDVLITSLFPTAIIGRILKLMLPHVVLISFEHSVNIKNFLRRWMLTRTARLVDLSFSDSPATLRAMQVIYAESGTPQELIQLIGVENSPKEILLELNKAPIHLLSVGRLVPEKNYAFLLKELSFLKSKSVPCELWLVGDGVQRRDLENLAFNLGVEKIVKFMGTRRDVEAFLARADIYVQTSLWEGQCLTVIEAMAAGLPVVTSNVGGIQDYSIDGENCLHFSLQEAGSLAAQIVRLVEQPRLAMEIVAGGYATVDRKFSKEIQQRSLDNAMNLIKEICVCKRQAG